MDFISSLFNESPYILIAIIIALLVIIGQTTFAIINARAKRKRFANSKFALETESNYATVVSNKGIIGEYQLGLELERFDPEGYHLFNVYIPLVNGSTSEIDALCINATGIYVFENKNYSGWVFGNVNDRTWTQTFPNGNHYKCPNPVKQNEGHVRALQKYLELDRIFFFSVIVFSDECELKRVDGGDIPVIQTADVVPVLSAIRQQRAPMFSSNEVFELYLKLKECANISEQEKAEHVKRVSRAHDINASN